MTEDELEKVLYWKLYDAAKENYAKVNIDFLDEDHIHSVVRMMYDARIDDYKRALLGGDTKSDS